MARRRQHASFWGSVGFAGRGVWEAALTEPNVRRQLIIFAAVLAAGAWLNVPARELLILWVVGGVVLGFELVNSALESALDALHPQRSEGVRRAKDIAAGAVLVASIMAAVVGVALLGPALLAWLA